MKAIAEDWRRPLAPDRDDDQVAFLVNSKRLSNMPVDEFLTRLVVSMLRASESDFQAAIDDDGEF